MTIYFDWNTTRYFSKNGKSATFDHLEASLPGTSFRHTCYSTKEDRY